MIQESEPPNLRIAAILTKNGQSWSSHEKACVLDRLLRLDPYGLSLCAERYFYHRWPGISLEDTDEIFNSFLARRIDRLLGLYDPEKGDLGTYIRYCLIRHCNAGATRLWRKKEEESSILSANGEEDLLRALDTSVEGNPERCLEQRMLRQTIEDALQSAVAELPDRFREVVEMFSDGKSYDTIAEDLGVSLAIVKNRLHRARQRLRSKLAHLR